MLCLCHLSGDRPCLPGYCYVTISRIQPESGEGEWEHGGGRPLYKGLGQSASHYFCSYPVGRVLVIWQRLLAKSLRNVVSRGSLKVCSCHHHCQPESQLRPAVFKVMTLVFDLSFILTSDWPELRYMVTCEESQEVSFVAGRQVLGGGKNGFWRLLAISLTQRFLSSLSTLDLPVWILYLFLYFKI